MTHDEVQAHNKAYGYFGFYDEICKICNQLFNTSHRSSDLECLAPGLYPYVGLGTFFIPPDSFVLTGGSTTPYNPGDKKSKIAVSPKKYTTECPCGINPKDCDYHR